MLTVMFAGILAAAAPGVDSESAIEPAAIDLSAFSVPAATVLATMHRVSLDPGSVAAAGVSLSESVAMLTAAAAALEENATALATADDALGAARASVGSIERSIRAGQAQDTQAAVEALNSARATLASATAARDTVLATVIDATTANLSNAQKSALAAIRASHRTWSELPAAYRVIVNEDSALLELRGALAAKQIAARENEPVPDDAAAVLSQWSQSPEVSAALAAQDANAAMIAANWATSVQPGVP